MRMTKEQARALVVVLLLTHKYKYASMFVIEMFVVVSSTGSIRRLGQLLRNHRHKIGRQTCNWRHHAAQSNTENPHEV